MHFPSRQYHLFISNDDSVTLKLKHSRLFSIEETNQHLVPLVDTCEKFPDFASNDDVRKLIRLLNDMEEAVELSAEKLEACQLTVQLIHVAAAVGTVQKQLRVKDQPDEVCLNLSFL